MDPLVATAIHDAKNALNILNVRLDEARHQAPSPALEEARAVASRVSAQLVELLSLYRAHAGSLRLAVEDHYLDDFCADVLAELGPIPPGLTLSTDSSAATQIGSWAFDAYQVKFVVLDALRNALRHARTTVAFSLAAEPDGGIRFTVADDGPGYPAEILVGDSQAMKDGSSGLGLTFARVIASAHATPGGRHGRVELVNADGARLALILP